ncbi:MAG: D-tyrosyl-tRNA(Tyr) deacylase [Rikenellaceae bacterium]|nr:D-tyrosyl-tRNA(Tyr) deacylase [Rikenellaceae bacterium]
MRVVVQRVRSASVEIDGKEFSRIGPGILVLLGVEHGDTDEDAAWLVRKLAALRIFDDADGVMNINIGDADGQAMVVSQFTLHASTRKGNRPSYIRAAAEPLSRPMYEKFVAMLQEAIARPVATGRFGADMQVALVNDGPVSIIIDSKLRE